MLQGERLFGLAVFHEEFGTLRFSMKTATTTMMITMFWGQTEMATTETGTVAEETGEETATGTPTAARRLA